MTRESEKILLEFCARQRDRFDEAEWLKIPHPNREEFLAALLFLAGVDWYGHREKLVALAKKLAPDDYGRLSGLVRRTGFDLSRFSTMLRQKIKHESVVRAS